MHLVGYLYEDYRDARSLEHKISVSSSTAKNPKIKFSFWILTNEDRTDILSRNVGKTLPLVAA
jgi:hypothetical protein